MAPVARSSKSSAGSVNYFFSAISVSKWSLGGLSRNSDAGFGFSVKFWHSQYFFHGFSLRKLVFGEKTVVLASEKFVSVIRVTQAKILGH